jgi:outer membrane protein
VTAKLTAILATLAGLSATSTSFAQAGVPVAPAGAPPNAAAKATGAAADAASVTSTPAASREAPKGRSTVMEAFAPQPQGLTAKEVARRAVASSHTIEAKNAELRAAASRVDTTMYQFFPRLGFKAGYTRLSPVTATLGGGNAVGTRNTGVLTVDPNTGQVVDSGGSPAMSVFSAFNLKSINDNYSLGASLSVPLSDYVLRLSDSIEGTKRDRQATELNVKAERAKVEGDARVAFFNWARAIGQVAVTENSIERVRARLKDVEASFTVGMVTKTEVLRLQSMVASTEAGLEAARAFRELASQQLAVIMNDPEPNYALGEDVLAPTASRPIEPLNKLVTEAQTQRYELQALDQAAQSLGRAESVVRAGQLPRLDGFANYDYANPNQRYFYMKGWNGTWAVGAQATWAINDVLINRASANGFAAQREALVANRRALADGVRLEVTSAYTDAKRAAAELEAAKRATEASQAAYDTAIQLFKVGKATTSELIDSEGELVVSQLRLINAHIDIRVAETKLTRALGRDMNKISN